MAAVTEHERPGVRHVRLQRPASARALTRAETEADPNQASAAALDGNYGNVVKTGRFAAKSTWSLGGNGTVSAGVSYEGQSLFHPIVNQIFVDFDGPGPNAPVEVFSLLIDTDRDLGAMMRYDRRLGAHDLLAGINFGKGSADGGNYRNLRGQPNGITEYYNSDSDSAEGFVVDRWRLSSRWTTVIGAQFVSAARGVRVNNAISGAITNPDARYHTINPRAGVIASLGTTGEIYGNVSRLFEAPTTFQLIDQVRGGTATLDPMSGTVAEFGCPLLDPRHLRIVSLGDVRCLQHLQFTHHHLVARHRPMSAVLFSPCPRGDRSAR
ncbi:MAG: TonB-dependent receptor [Vicinamibacterales bacterium]